MTQGEVGQEMYIIVAGDRVVIEVDEKEIGEVGTGDFFGELGALFKPGTFKDPVSGRPLNGHKRLRSAFASKAEVTLGILSYDDFVELRKQRPQLTDEMAPYIDATAEALGLGPETNHWRRDAMLSGDSGQLPIVGEAEPAAQAQTERRLENVETLLASQGQLLASQGQQLDRIEKMLTAMK